MATPIVLAFFLFFFLQIHIGYSATDRFNYSGFEKANLTLDGSARITDKGLLQLTNLTPFIVGHAFYPSPINLFNNRSSKNGTVSSFSTSFVFGVLPSDKKRGGGHGFAFTMTPFDNLANASSSHYLGLFNKDNDGNDTNHIFAVEFDTVSAGGGFGDQDSNHVGIDVNGLKSRFAEPASYYLANGSTRRVDIAMESGKPIKVWIEYDGVHGSINVTLSPLDVPKPSSPLLSKPLNLSGILNGSVYLGFSAATGKLTSSHYIQGWSFRLNGTADPINLSTLPSLPQDYWLSASKRHTALIVLPVVFSVFTIIGFLYLYWVRKKRVEENLEDWELDCPHRFRYKDLYIATKSFKASEIIGVGGFGTVYKGVLPNTGEEIAVKKILHDSRQGVKEFVAEISSLGRLSHKNLVHLLGWCKRDGDLLLVYDFVPNGSLYTNLVARRDNFVLSWEQRFKIIKGVASGLVYLHQDWEQMVVHRDIKASNVLLDSDMNGRLGDFGLARLYDHGENPQTTHLVGTLGYIAPELAQTGKATASSDVFAYGTLLLVVATGKGPVSPSVGHSTLLEWVSHCYREDCLMDVVDEKLQSSYVIEEMEIVLKLGLICSHWNSHSRPTMRQVMRILHGDDLLPDGDVASGVCLRESSSYNFANVDCCTFNISGTDTSQNSSIAAISSDSIRDGR